MRILVLNGPNLNMLGKREPSVYGNKTLGDIVRFLSTYADSKAIEISFFQSNFEGELINALHNANEDHDGIVFNPGAYTHYSYALRDAIASIRVPVLEVHISNVHAREEFRATSVTAPVCIGQISGLGFLGYKLAIDFFINSYLEAQNE